MRHLFEVAIKENWGNFTKLKKHDIAKGRLNKTMSCSTVAAQKCSLRHLKQRYWNIVILSNNPVICAIAMSDVDCSGNGFFFPNFSISLHSMVNVALNYTIMVAASFT